MSIPTRSRPKLQLSLTDVVPVTSNQMLLLTKADQD